MVKYHPDTRFLTDYAAGSLPEAQALCVASHLHYCPACRAKVAELTTLGEVLFQSQPPAALRDDEFSALMARIDASALSDDNDAIHVDTRPVTEPAPSTLPAVICKLAGTNLGKLRWRKMGKHFTYSRLNHATDPRETALFHIRAGGSVPRHQHQGDEITVVLKGSFSDHDDHYHAGDFIIRTKGEKHRPVASQDEDCLCLSTLDAPLVMTNWVYRLLTPLVQRRLA